MDRNSDSTMGIPSAPSERASGGRGPGVVGLSLRRNFSWTFAGNVVYAASQWGMLTVLAKLGNPTMVGQFGLGLAVTAPVIAFSNLQLRQIQATDAAEEYAFGDYLALRLVMTLAAFAVIVCLVLLGGYAADTKLVIVAVGLAKSFEAISDVFYGLFQHYEHMDRIGVSMMIKGPGSLAALWLGVSITHSVFWGALTMAGVWALILVIYDAGNGRRLLQGLHRRPLTGMLSGLSTDYGILRRLWWLALPLGIVTVLGSLTTNIPRYFIAHYLGEHQLGLFTAMSYIMVAGTTVISALGQSATPRLSRFYADGDRTGFSSLIIKLVCIGVLIGSAGLVVVGVCGRWILSAAYTSEYAQDVDVFVWIAAASAMTYVGLFLIQSMTAARYLRIQVPLRLISAVITLVACWVLVPRNGLLGAAQALLISAVLYTVSTGLVNLHAIARMGAHQDANLDGLLQEAEDGG